MKLLTNLIICDEMWTGRNHRKEVLSHETQLSSKTLSE